MSNSEPSAIVLPGIPCICGLYKLRFEWSPTDRASFAAIRPFCSEKLVGPEGFEPSTNGL